MDTIAKAVDDFDEMRKEMGKDQERTNGSVEKLPSPSENRSKSGEPSVHRGSLLG